MYIYIYLYNIYIYIYIYIYKDRQIDTYMYTHIYIYIYNTHVIEVSGVAARPVRLEHDAERVAPPSPHPSLVRRLILLS